MKIKYARGDADEFGVGVFFSCFDDLIGWEMREVCGRTCFGGGNKLGYLDHTAKVSVGRGRRGEEGEKGRQELVTSHTSKG